MKPSCIHCGRKVLQGEMHELDCASLTVQLNLDLPMELEENSLRPVLMDTEISYRTQYVLMDLLGMPRAAGNRWARHNFEEGWLKLIGHSDMNYYDNVETFLCLLSVMSTNELKAFVDSLFWK